MFKGPDSLSQLIDSLEYDDRPLLDSIPEREWRLLAALARKRDENEQRDRLADQFKKMWQKEKEERNNVEAESLDQYKRYIHAKREQERLRLEYRRLQRGMEEQAKTGELLDGIRYKEKRSADLLAWRDDKKISEILDKALDDEERSHLAANRRAQLGHAKQWQRRLELMDGLKRADEAKRRRSAILKQASQRLAMSNTLTAWETSLLREEVCAMEDLRRASHAAHAALTEQRSARLLRARDAKLSRARRLAAITAQMREEVKSGR